METVKKRILYTARCLDKAHGLLLHETDPCVRMSLMEECERMARARHMLESLECVPEEGGRIMRPWMEFGEGAYIKDIINWFDQSFFFRK